MMDSSMACRIPQKN